MGNKRGVNLSSAIATALVLTLSFLFLTALSSTLALAATIHGSIFTYNLERVQGAIVTIDTKPAQLFVSVNGTYEFNAPKGNYTISAIQKNQYDIIIAYANNTITIVDDGSYVRDLILFPNEDLSDLDLENDIGSELYDESKGLKTNTAATVSALAIGIIVFGAALFFVLRKNKQDEATIEMKNTPAEKEGRPSSESVKTRDTTDLAAEDRDELADLLGFIRREKRTTQKDIRKEFPLSEAKISLMITELESKGRIKKIKKGRGNIILFEK